MLENGQKIEILENPLAILESKEILAVLKKHWVANHENLADPEKFVEEFFAEIGELGSNREINKLYQKKLKEFRDDSLDLGKPGDMFLEMTEQDLQGVETVLDFGCGKLAFLKNMAEKNSDIQRLIGIDLKSQPVLEGLDTRIEFHRSLSEIVDVSVDLVTIKLVLHHLESEQEAREIFAELRRVLKSGGKLVVFEESFPCHSRGNENLVSEPCDWIPDQVGNDIAEARKYLARYKMELSGVTADFLQLSREDKIKFLFINDWLMNLQNTYMPWTMQYKSIEEWIALIESVGFTKKEAHFLGAIKHRKRKQGMTAELIFQN